MTEYIDDSWGQIAESRYCPNCAARMDEQNPEGEAAHDRQL